MFKDFLILSLKNLKYRQIRSFLTIVGIIIGIAVIIAVLFLGNGLKDSVKQLLGRFGGDLILIIPGEVTDPTTRLVGEARFRPKDVEALKEVVGVDTILPSLESKLSTAEFLGEEKSVSLHIAPWAPMKKISEESQGFKLEKGRWPEREDAREVILGKKFAQKKFKNQIFIGDDIIIKGKKFKVVGILTEVGEPIHDSSIFISSLAYEKLTGEKIDFLLITIKVLPGFDPGQVAYDIEYVLSKQKGITEFTVMTSDKAMQIVGSIIGIIELALFLIASIALVVGGVGIANTMYTSVLERTSEIGVMKAIGGRTKDILLIFIFEAGTIGFIGGLFGVLGGLFLAKIVEVIAHNQGFLLFQVNVPLKIVLGALLFAFLVGVISGFLPARAAARLKPIDALRYE